MLSDSFVCSVCNLMVYRKIMIHCSNKPFAMYITTVEYEDELTFVVLPVCTANKLMDELLCNGFLDLSKYMDTTFIQYEPYDKSRLKKVCEDQQ